EVRDVAPGLWIWRLPHPAWKHGLGWEETVTSTCVESGGEVAVLDALAPPDDAREVWERLDARPPTLVVVLKPDHVPDVDLFIERYDARGFGPYLFWPDDVPRSHLTGIQPDRFEIVIVAHGEPVHDRAAYERALAAHPWSG